MTVGTGGRSLELFFIDGRSDGMLTAEVFGWMGHVLMTPRTRISDALKRKEASYTGIYLLFGEDEKGEPLAYIGESENVSDRIRSHDSKKDWWTTAILITSAANNLNKAHARYLEARLIEVAKDIGKVTLENGTAPPLPGLNEAAKANMEAYLENILMILPALRIDSFVKSTRPTLPIDGDGNPSPDKPLFEILVPKRNIRATARLINNEFVVQVGSLAAKAWETASTIENHPYALLYAQLVKTGKLQEQGEHRRFSESYAFASASAAASVVHGHPKSGPTAWKIKGQKKTYKDWEAENLKKD